MIGERINLYLGQVDSCICCDNNRLTKDHIFQTRVGQDHPKVLGSIIKEPINKVRVCEDHHSEIDKDKWWEYQTKGIFGQVLYIARYPRARSSDLRDLQTIQWIELFTEVQSNILALNGNTPPHLKSGYSKVADFIGGCLHKWAAGDFDDMLCSRQ